MFAATVRVETISLNVTAASDVELHLLAPHPIDLFASNDHTQIPRGTCGQGMAAMTTVWLLSLRWGAPLFMGFFVTNCGV